MKESHFLRCLLPGNRLRLAASWVLGLASVGLVLVLPQQLSRLTNLFAENKSPHWATVHWAIGYLIAAQLAVSLLGYWRRKMEMELQEAMVRNLTLELFERLLRFSADFFNDREVERINTRAVEDSSRVATFWAEAVLGVPLAVVSLVVFAAMMLARNWFLGACMIPLSLLSGYFIFFDRRIQALNTRDRETRESIRAEANQAVGGVAELRAHYAFDYGLASLRRSFADYQRLMTEMGKLTALFQALSPLISTLQIGVLIWIGASLCLGGSPLAAFAGQLSWGDVIAFLFLLQLFQRPVTDITGFVVRWRLARESIRRVEEFLDRPRVFESAGGEPALPIGPLPVGFERISVRAPSGAPILNEVELTLIPGEHVALAGPAGCGKSTAIQLVVRGIAASNGRLVLGPQRVEEYHVESMAREVGFVPQKPVLFNTSIRNNLLLGLRRAPAPVATGGPPVATTRGLADAEGPIDITRLESVKDLGDLDRELLRVVRLVDLEADVLRKCLDNPLPASREPSPFRARIRALRLAVSDRLKDAAAQVCVPFHPSRYLPGPLSSNLVWVGAVGEEPLSALAARVHDALQSEALLDQLLEFGRRQLLSDQALTVRAVQREPRLLEFLPVRPVALDKGAALADRKDVPLGALPRDLRLVLLEAALEGDSATAQKRFEKADFAGRVVAARQLIADRNAGWRGGWRPLDPEEYLPRIGLRENLLGGRVDLRLLGAADRVDGAIKEVLEEQGLLAEALLAGLEFVVGEGGKYLSGGQKQKTAIARVLLKNPSLLLLDEATAALDELSQARIVEMVRRDFAGKTVVSISHRLSTIRHCDRIVVLDHGQLAQQGTYEELVAQEGIFQELVRQEHGGAPAAARAEPAASKGGDVTELRRQLPLCPLFAHLKSDSLAFVERLTKVMHCAAGQVLFRQGDVGSQFYLILEGQVDFFVERPDGDQVRREVVNTYGPGGSFGELALFGTGRRTLGAAARTDLHLGVLERDDLLQLLAADPQIAVALLRAVATRQAEQTAHAYPQG
jgi:putative ABC transport system ATP-binding protein